MLISAINISEGSDEALITAIAATADQALLDQHVDPHHNRSVLTIGAADVVEIAIAIAAEAIAVLDIRLHTGVHPRLGIVDVVPFVPYSSSGPPSSQQMNLAIEARNEFAAIAWEKLSLPCFLYGPERSLPEVRRRAYVDLWPEHGGDEPHLSAGSCCAGARPPLVAYNVYLQRRDLALAQQIASELRSPNVRALGFQVGDDVQVSFNLIAPDLVTPLDVYEGVAERAAIVRAELVGLIPSYLLAQIPRERWADLDLSEDRTIEARLACALS